MPSATALSMSAWKISGRAAERQIPAGCCSTTCRKIPTSPLGSYVTGPVISAFTPSALAASRKPACASCQYGKLILVATKTYRSFSSWYGFAHATMIVATKRIRKHASVIPYFLIAILLSHSSLTFGGVPCSDGSLVERERFRAVSSGG